MNILSLFDGMSCGQLALNKLGIKYENYFASEIDKYAMAVTRYNFPNTKFVGDVTRIKSSDLPKIDLLIGGSPCQGFSFAGKQLNFNDVRSKLFFEYVRLLKELKPKYFLLENVVMKKEYQDVISKELGVEPIKINSSLVSAQNRNRLYWTNIPNVTIPSDKKTYLPDILEKNVNNKYYLSLKMINGFLNKKSVFRERFRPFDPDNDVKEKAYCLTARYYKQSTTDQYVLDRPLRLMDIGGGGQGNRVYSDNCKSVTLSALGGGRGAKSGLYFVNRGIRRLTPIECERLQTVPDNYTLNGIFEDEKQKIISDTQRYKMLGNGWTIDVIAHIFKNITQN